MKLSNYARMYEKLLSKGFDATKTAAFLLESLTQARRNGVDTDVFNDEMLEEFLQEMKNGNITKEVHLELLAEWSKNTSMKLQSIIAGRNIGSASTGDVEKAVREIIARNSKLIDEKGMHALSALMGEAMKELKGRVSGNEISSALRRELEKKVKKGK